MNHFIINIIDKMFNNFCDTFYHVFQKFLNHVAETREPHLHFDVSEILEVIKSHLENKLHDEMLLHNSFQLPSKRENLVNYYRNRNSKYTERSRKLGKTI